MSFSGKGLAMKKMISLSAVVCLGLAIGCQDSKEMDAAKAKMRQAGENLKEGAEKAGEAIKEEAAEGEAKMKELSDEATPAIKKGVHKAAGAIKDEAAEAEDATK